MRVRAKKYWYWLRSQTTSRTAFFWVGMPLYVSGCLLPPPLDPIDPALLVLNSVASEVGAITRRVSEIQQHSLPVFKEPRAQDPRLLARISVLDYVGPPANLLQELATRIGYSYVEMGSAMPTSTGRTTPFAVTVTLRSKQQTVLNIVREVAAQVGNNIVVSISEAQQELRLEYL